MIFEKLRIKPRTLKILVGALLMKFSTSVTTCWGNINLYFLSQFHYQGWHITPQTNSSILLISVIPMVISLVLATRICNRYGYQFVLRLCSLIFFISPLVNLIFFRLDTFVIFSIIIPGSMFALGSVPILNCMWTQFPESKNRITAALVVAFGIGSIVWNLLFMHMINPENEAAVQHGNISFFSQKVSHNVRKTAIIGFGVTGILSIIGSLMIERKNDQPPNAEEEKQEEEEEEEQKNTILQEQIRHKEDIATQFQVAIKDERFLIIVLISFLTGLYEIHLMMNFKIIFMPLVNDDHFLSYCSMLGSVVAVCGAFLWGYLGDSKGVAFTILLLSILDLGSKIYSDLAITKTMIIFMIILIGLISKSMTTLAGPGFVEYFGIGVGTELLPYKGVAILVGYLAVPFFQLLTAPYLTPQQYLICLSFASIITLACSIRLFVLDRRVKKNQNVIQTIQFITDR